MKIFEDSKTLQNSYASTLNNESGTREMYRCLNPLIMSLFREEPSLFVQLFMEGLNITNYVLPQLYLYLYNSEDCKKLCSVLLELIDNIPPELAFRTIINLHGNLFSKGLNAIDFLESVNLLIKKALTVDFFSPLDRVIVEFFQANRKYLLENDSKGMELFSSVVKEVSKGSNDCYVLFDLASMLMKEIGIITEYCLFFSKKDHSKQ